MDGANGLANWWFTAGRVGGWAVFLLLALAAVAWMIYDSRSRRIPLLGWLLGAFVAVLWLLPSAVLGLIPSVRAQIAHLQQTVVYLGFIGGLVPVGVAVGYGIVHRGRKGCAQGHLYDASLDGCPECLGKAGAPQQAPPRQSPRPVQTPQATGPRPGSAQPPPPGPRPQSVPQQRHTPPAPERRAPQGPGPQQAQTAPRPPHPPTSTQRYGQQGPSSPDRYGARTQVPQRAEQGTRPAPSRVIGWLVDEKNGRRYQLKRGDTHVGRSRDNDIVFADPTVSRHHLVIRQQESRFIIHDRGSTSGTYVNGHRLEHPALLAGGETILIGETELRFAKSAASPPSTETPTRRM
jgi:pSer/pThr/pTyr-binding forkhead associated (FHA) protein